MSQKSPVGDPITEHLSDGHEWLRVADPAWGDPVDPSFAANRGGRWNPAESHPTLYVNEDVVTARINMQLWADAWPYEPEDLRAEHAPVLVGAELPRAQHVADVHTPDGVAALGLPSSYPVDHTGATVTHEVCQPIGVRLHSLGLRGVRCRSARSPLGAGRELAWFPATTRSRATVTSVRSFDEWFWA